MNRKREMSIEREDGRARGVTRLAPKGGLVKQKKTRSRATGGQTEADGPLMPSRASQALARFASESMPQRSAPCTMKA
jgi:hypothetical protein